MIEQIIQTAEDEVLFALGKELGNLYFHLPKFHPRIIGFLTELCQQEETVIRDQAVASLEHIARNMNSAQLEDHLVPIINKFLEIDT